MDFFLVIFFLFSGYSQWNLLLAPFLAFSFYLITGWSFNLHDIFSCLKHFITFWFSIIRFININVFFRQLWYNSRREAIIQYIARRSASIPVNKTPNLISFFSFLLVLMMKTLFFAVRYFGRWKHRLNHLQNPIDRKQKWNVACFNIDRCQYNDQ